MNQRILVVGDLDLWLLQDSGQVVPRAGNQSFFNTLLGYDRSGWEVLFLTPRAVHGGIDHVGTGIRIERAPLSMEAPVRAVRRVASTLRNRFRDPAPDRAPGSLPRTRLDIEAIDNPGRWLAFQAEMGVRVLARCLRHRPDVLYGYEVYGAPVAVAVGRMLGIPSVTRFQGTLLGGLVDAPWRLRRVRTHAAALRAPADLVIMADDGTRGDEVLSLLGQPSDRVRFWINGVVKSDVVMAGRQLQESGGRERGDPLRMFTASRLVEWKRVDRILDVLHRLPMNLPPWTAEIAGDGPERLALEARARDLGLGDRVRFTGPLSHEDVLDRLVRSDVYVSLYDISNLSNGTLEAMVAGVPVFALDVGGTNHVVRDGCNGILVHPDRLAVEGVARLGALLANPSERRAMAERAAATGESLETWEDRMAREVAEIEDLVRLRQQRRHP
jgi:glycosyltransferase involved in cell wall biosynthesis